MANCTSKNQDIPHASKKLNQTTIGKGSSDDNVGLGKTTSAEVDQGKNKGSQGKGTETKRSGVGKLAVGDGLVETRLEFTTKGRKADRLASVDVRKRIGVFVVVCLALLDRNEVCRRMIVAIDLVDAVDVLLEAVGSVRLRVDGVLFYVGSHGGGQMMSRNKDVGCRGWISSRQDKEQCKGAGNCQTAREPSILIRVDPPLINLIPTW
jgi:hypothetical protein